MTNTFVMNNTTVYAATKKYTIVYNANGGKGTMSNTTVTYGKNTALRANSFTRTGYSFKGWYAYRTSDKKWLCKHNTSGTQKWMTANQLSKNKNYSKALYKNKAVVAKTTSVNNDKVFMYAQWKQITYTKNARNTVTTSPIGLNDHGWTIFNIYYNVNEKYTMNDTNVTYKYRSLYSYCTTGRASWDNPYNISYSGLTHINSKGILLKAFKMTNIKDNIFPTNICARTSKENYDSVTYKRKSNNYGQFIVSISAPTCINPTVTKIKYSLNV